MSNAIALSPELNGQLLVIAVRELGKLQFGIMKTDEGKIVAVGELMDPEQALEAALAMLKLIVANAGPSERETIMRQIREHLPQLFNS